MLADVSSSGGSGDFSKDLHLPATSLHMLIDFIKDELPLWRDRADRRREKAETVLTSQLCAHLNSAARQSGGWDFLQFRVEESDEVKRGRKVDLVPAPCAATAWVEGRRHADFDPLLPIECKRLPTPKGKERDEREYVVSRFSTTGGIQRFKAGHHGAIHKLGVMIAYLQEGTLASWDAQIKEWIDQLVARGQSGWTRGDLLRVEYADKSLRIASLHSVHRRERKLSAIELRHLWLEMN